MGMGSLAMGFLAIGVNQYAFLNARQLRELSLDADINHADIEVVT